MILQTCIIYDYIFIHPVISEKTGMSKFKENILGIPYGKLLNSLMLQMNL